MILIRRNALLQRQTEVNYMTIALVIRQHNIKEQLHRIALRNGGWA